MFEPHKLNKSLSDNIIYLRSDFHYLCDILFKYFQEKIIVLPNGFSNDDSQPKSMAKFFSLWRKVLLFENHS